MKRLASFISATCIVSVFVIILTFSGLGLVNNASFAQEPDQTTGTGCITLDSDEENGKNTITVSCSHPSTLTDIYNSIQNQDILKREDNSNYSPWILDATIIVEKDSTFVINSSDTKWLKILAGDKNGDGDRDIVNSITVFGNLIIDSVKITSWDPEKNDVIKFEVDILPSREFEHTGIDAIPRPYIKTEDETTGTMNITNSEIAYLGYECGSGCSGISYYGNNGTSIVKNNEIHHDRFGFYSVGVGGVVLEDNNVHDNFMYGFDPHTATHDMIIRNNTVHDHGAMGIICSLDCYNITIEGNEVYNSAGSGIMFSRNMSDSVARNNDVHDEEKCIFLSQSSNNEVYDNDISNCEGQGIYIYHNSIGNKVYNNTLTNATEGIEESDDSQGTNEISNNRIE
ncbi:MAG: right-handed parallel beta-helix repeat-containing protein [Candidatus Nitrosocosmicus sp.]|nr:right-handed parallel beta-helix repeat-containing protein [Candidatus Nitrosocosmicus sp.]